MGYVREPYATLFAQYHDHWLLAPYLTGDEPDWSGMAREPRMDALSLGEKVLLDFAAAWANAQVYLDEAHRYQVGLALLRVYGVSA